MTHPQVAARPERERPNSHRTILLAAEVPGRWACNRLTEGWRILIRTASPATRLEDRATRVVDTIDPAPGTRLPLTPSTASPG